MIECTTMEGLQDRQNTARSKDETAEMVTEVTNSKEISGLWKRLRKPASSSPARPGAGSQGYQGIAENT